MDPLQIALILLIILLGTMLSILGFQVFAILKDLKKNLDKLDKFVSEAEEVTSEIKQAGQALEKETVTRVRKTIPEGKSVKRLFRKRVGI